jgi:D-serine deaminase-like pyridoxal phosphate-dependent protein
LVSEQLEDQDGEDGPPDDPLRRARIARELQTDAIDSVKLGQVDEAIAVSDQLMGLFAREREPLALAVVADSLVGTASVLAWTRRTDQSVAGETLSRVTTFGRSLFLAHRSASAEPPPDRDRRRKLEQALKIDDALIARLGESPDRELHRIVVEANINRCGTLLLLGHVKRSASLFNDLLEHPDPAYAQIAEHDAAYVERQVARALLKATPGKRRDDP